METTLLTEAIQQAPTLGVLVFIVWIFLKHLGKCEDRHHTLQKDCIRAINENTLALGKNCEILDKVNITLEKLNDH